MQQKYIFASCWVPHSSLWCHLPYDKPSCHALPYFHFKQVQLRIDSFRCRSTYRLHEHYGTQSVSPKLPCTFPWGLLSLHLSWSYTSISYLAWEVGMVAGGLEWRVCILPSQRGNLARSCLTFTALLKDKNIVLSVACQHVTYCVNAIPYQFRSMYDVLQIKFEK